MFASKVAKPPLTAVGRPVPARVFRPPPSAGVANGAEWDRPRIALSGSAPGASWNFSGAPTTASDREPGLGSAGAPNFASGGEPLQAKLLVGASDDPQEQEADRVADHVMSPTDPESVPRAAPGAADRGRTATSDPAPRVRAQSVEMRGQAAIEAPAIVSEALRASAEPLDPALRGRFEQRFDYDFGQVRVHRDGVAAQAAAAVGARAFTAGADVVFGAGQYAPSTPAGKRLLAHELTHVAQQGAAGVVRRDPVPSARLTSDPTRATLSAQQKLQIDSVLQHHQVVIYSREKRARFDGQSMSLQQAIAMVRREAGILLPSDDAIAAYIDSQFLKYFNRPGAAGGGESSGLLRQGIPMPFGLDRPAQTLEPRLTGADVDRIRGFLAAGHLAAGPGLQPMFNGAPAALDDITEQCRALVLPIIPADKVGAIVGAEWSILVRKALQAPLPPPPPFTVIFDGPPDLKAAPDKPDKLATAAGWQGTYHVSHKGKFENTVLVQLTQGDGAVQRVYQFQVNTTTGDVQALIGVQVQSPDVTIADTKLFNAIRATIKASAFLQLVGGINNAGGNSASGALTLQLQGGVQAVVTLGPITATVQIGPTLTLQQGMSPDLSLNPAAQGGGVELPHGDFPSFHGITLFRGSF